MPLPASLVASIVSAVIEMVAQSSTVSTTQYDSYIAKRVLPPEVKPWERDKMDDDDDGLENTFDRFVRNGQPPVR